MSEISKLNRKINDFNIKLIKGDIRDEGLLEKLLAEAQTLEKPFQAVIHFARFNSVKDSVVDPLLLYGLPYLPSEFVNLFPSA